MIMEKIRQKYSGLTKSQKQLADYITSSYRDVAFLTASRLAKALSLNEATVIRFAQRLGYAGYPQLIEDVQRLVQDELGPPAGGTASSDTSLTRVMEIELDGVKRAMAKVTDQTAEQAMTMIRESQHICVLGQGVGGPLAQILAVGLRAIGLSADSPSADPLSLAMALREVREGWLVISVSLALETQELANALRYAKEHGARTMALTWSHTSRCAQAAELAISYVPDDTLPLRSATPLALIIDSLLQTLACADDATRNRVAEFGSIRDQLLADTE